MGNLDRYDYEALFNPECLATLVDEHGDAHRIKKEVKTPAKTYEIRTAIRYWLGDRTDWRCSEAFKYRLEAYEDGASIEHAMDL